MAISSSRYVSINSVLVPTTSGAASSGGGGLTPDPPANTLLINGEQLLMNGETVVNSLGE